MADMNVNENDLINKVYLIEILNQLVLGGKNIQTPEHASMWALMLQLHGLQNSWIPARISHLPELHAFPQ